MEALIRFGVFLGVFTAMILWEFFRPRRLLSQPRRERWVTNLGIIFLNMAKSSTNRVITTPVQEGTEIQCSNPTSRSAANTAVV